MHADKALKHSYDLEKDIFCFAKNFNYEKKYICFNIFKKFKY